MTATVDAPAAPSLVDIARTALEEHHLSLDAGCASVLHAVRSGAALIAARELVPRGGWMRWLGENFEPGTTYAYLYMRIARTPEVHDSPNVEQARRRLLKLGPDQVRASHHAPPELREEVQRQREEGRTWREITEDTGFSEPALLCLIDPSKRAARRVRDGRYRARLSRERAARVALREKEHAKAVKSAAVKKGGAIHELWATADGRTTDLLAAAREQFDSRWDKETLAEATALHNKYRDKIVQLLGVS